MKLNRFEIAHLVVLLIAVVAIWTVALDRVIAAPNVEVFVSCVERPSESGSPRFHMGYRSDSTADATSAWTVVAGEDVGVAGGPPNEIVAGEHKDIFFFELNSPNAGVTWELYSGDFYASIFVDVNTAAPECGQPDPGYGHLDGGLTTITKDVGPGCYEWSIVDAYGNSSKVAVTQSQTEGDHTFTRLVLGRDNPNHDAGSYSVVGVPCS